MRNASPDSPQAERAVTDTSQQQVENALAKGIHDPYGCA